MPQALLCSYFLHIEALCLTGKRVAHHTGKANKSYMTRDGRKLRNSRDQFYHSITVASFGAEETPQFGCQQVGQGPPEMQLSQVVSHARLGFLVMKLTLGCKKPLTLAPISNPSEKLLLRAGHVELSACPYCSNVQLAHTSQSVT